MFAFIVQTLDIKYAFVIQRIFKAEEIMEKNLLMTLDTAHI
jgi:hypothetical protein